MAHPLSPVLPVHPPRGGETVYGAVFHATEEGRVEIFYDTYDYEWILLEDWLNQELARALRN